MSSALEIVTLTDIEDTTANDSVFSEVVKIAAASGVGLRAQFWGNGVEQAKSKIRLWMLGWAGQPGMAPEAWQSVVNRIKELTPTPPRKITITLRSQNIIDDKCLTAPVTEVIFASMKPETEVDVFTGILDETLRLTSEQPGCKGTAWGYATGNDRGVVLFVGWNSIEDHERYAHMDGFREATKPFITAVSSADMFHVKFQSQ